MTLFLIILTLYLIITFPWEYHFYFNHFLAEMGFHTSHEPKCSVRHEFKEFQ